VPQVQVRWTGPTGSLRQADALGRRFWLNRRRYDLAAGDPYYNPNLNAETGDYTLASRRRPTLIETVTT
jgi:hypothetical protein